MSGSRYRISTPGLILDLDAFEHNVAEMAELCRRSGIALRPHVKTHKSTEIARRQIEAGAVGVCCATIEEVETMAAAGIRGILLTSPIVTMHKMTRLLAVATRAPDLMVVADNVENVAAWNTLARGANTRLSMLVDVDVGQHRSGVLSPQNAVTLASEIAGSDALHFAGVQAYAGHIQHVANFAERVNSTASVAAKVRAVVEALHAAGLPPFIVTGGGTGTHAIEPAFQALSELQAGSYVFMDAEYAGIDLDGGGSPIFMPSLFVQATVISVNVAGFVQTDAGTKAFALNGPPPEVVSGAPTNSLYSYLGDEHGRITLSQGAQPPQLGDRVECLTPHCDPTVNLYDCYLCVRGQELTDTWAIGGRHRQ